MSRTWDALRRADRRSARVGEPERVASWAEELADLRAALHALEVRLEREGNALRGELQQQWSKAEERSAARERTASDRLLAQLAALRDATERLARRSQWTLLGVVALGLALLLAL